jgi:hypothetical protein
MAKIVKTTMFGLPVIMRHDYEDVVIQEKLKGYQKKSVDAFLHFLTNVPNFSYGNLLDVGCGDDYCINLFAPHFKDTFGIDLFVENGEYDRIMKTDWDYMHWSPFRINAIFVNHSLEHAKSVYHLMQNISSLQYKDDALFIAVPDGNSAFGHSITSSTTHFSCITEGYLSTTLQRFGYRVAIETREFRPGAPEIWAFAIKQYDGFPL